VPSLSVPSSQILGMAVEISDHYFFFIVVKVPWLIKFKGRVCSFVHRGYSVFSEVYTVNTSTSLISVISEDFTIECWV